jgi:hypothetical protein
LLQPLPVPSVLTSLLLVTPSSNSEYIALSSQVLNANCTSKLIHPLPCITYECQKLVLPNDTPLTLTAIVKTSACTLLPHCVVPAAALVANPVTAPPFAASAAFKKQMIIDLDALLPCLFFKCQLVCVYYKYIKKHCIYPSNVVSAVSIPYDLYAQCNIDSGQVSIVGTSSSSFFLIY